MADSKKPEIPQSVNDGIDVDESMVVVQTPSEGFARIGEELAENETHSVTPVPYDVVAAKADAITAPGKDRVSPILLTAAAWSWRFIAVVIAVGLLGYFVIQFSTILVALMVALLLAVVLEPMSSYMKNKWNWPSAAAAAAALIILVVVIAGLAVGAGTGIVSGFSELRNQVNAGIDSIVAYLTSTFPNLDSQIDKAWGSAQSALSNNSGKIVGGVMSVGSSVTGFTTGLILALFSLFFFLKDGRRLWHWLVRLLPVPYQNRANEAGIRAWMTIGNYTRTQAIVAAVDAVGIAIIAFALKTPLSLAFPIGVIVFLAAFIPIVGALLSGFVAVVVVLVNTQSIAFAIAMLIGILVVQQIEGNLLQPILQGNALNMHALAIVLVVTAGSTVAGVVGALFTVPIAAAINTAILYLRGHDIYPYLDTMTNRPGGAPQDFAEFKKAHWDHFNTHVAQQLPPKEARKAKREKRRAKRAQA